MKTKICTKCKQERLVEKFYGNKRARDGYDCWCKLCHKEHSLEYYRQNRAWICKRQRKRHLINGDYQLRYDLHRHFNITLEQYNAMLHYQNGKCAICECSETHTCNGKIKRLGVDHDHKSGKIRGLLCHKCNRALGLFQDNPELMKKAAAYVR
ncbi:MAG TPA: hypothetical protein ENI27_09215 [bacterium]|nr:hypothetical protein [bacterium]